jgi:hypothetical protein
MRKLAFVGNGSVVEVRCDRCRHWHGRPGDEEAPCALGGIQPDIFGCAHFEQRRPDGTGEFRLPRTSVPQRGT